MNITTRVKEFNGHDKFTIIATSAYGDFTLKFVVKDETKAKAIAKLKMQMALASDMINKERSTIGNI